VKYHGGRWQRPRWVKARSERRRVGVVSFMVAVWVVCVGVVVEVVSMRVVLDVWE
jgi:hypothetical protein